MKVEDSQPSKAVNWLDSHLRVLLFPKEDLADSQFLHLIAVLSVGGEKRRNNGDRVIDISQDLQD